MILKILSLYRKSMENRSKTSLHFWMYTTRVQQLVYITQPIKSTHLYSHFVPPPPSSFRRNGTLTYLDVYFSLSHLGNVISFSGCFRSSSLTLITRKNISSLFLNQFQSLEREPRLPKRCFYSPQNIVRLSQREPERNRRDVRLIRRQIDFRQLRLTSRLIKDSRAGDRCTLIFRIDGSLDNRDIIRKQNISPDLLRSLLD